ncbi:predicted protein [Lichtheimia corymbifera JMRC:FSU:9682]|uniref:Uncharacterized protein n=1 Tax=Lichtheimia corymbifera JMRC:FSU:9682 TaxID=1263082 RepID=A0A068SGQ2_9FUNG|nr:predicted protein [Lichtheimia corymbifera JMRC:FSU:9682]
MQRQAERDGDETVERFLNGVAECEAPVCFNVGGAKTWSMRSKVKRRKEKGIILQHTLPAQIVAFVSPAPYAIALYQLIGFNSRCTCIQAFLLC